MQRFNPLNFIQIAWKPLLPLLLSVHFWPRFAPAHGSGFDPKTNQKDQGSIKILTQNESLPG
jgi:hypothetical protein